MYVDRVFWCSVCETYFMVPANEFNCHLVVHLTVNGNVCNPHLPRAACDALRGQSNSVGCGRKYRIGGHPGAYTIAMIVGEHV